jgi:F-type H+-transporting ATPase subunit a
MVFNQLFFGIMVFKFFFFKISSRKKLQNTMEIFTYYHEKIYKTDASGALTEEHGHPTNVRPLDYP